MGHCNCVSSAVKWLVGDDDAKNEQVRGRLQPGATNEENIL